jgi:hypothetical protein
MDNVKEAADAAYGTIVSQVAAPYFFEKLAAYGIVPQSEKEAGEMWAAAHKLHVLYAAEQEKTAAERSGTMSAVNQRLDAALAAAGVTPATDEKRAAFERAAAVMADEPEIASAVLTLQAAAAAALQSE